jgi:ribosomal protein S18 acetylase RimI-like enzyme
MSPEVAIRPVTDEDADALLGLWRVTWAATYRAGLGDDAVARLNADLDRDGTSSMCPGLDEQALCCVADEALIGSVIIADREAAAYVWGLYVHPAWQHRGIGSRLIRSAAATVTIADTMEVRVIPSSRGALAFYRRLGFTEVGRETGEIATGVTVDMLRFAVPVAELKTPALERSTGHLQ